jgi:KUP system potassium uptake protein
MVVTVAVVAAFKNLSNLSNAYGFSVATVMFSTTVLLAVQMVWVKHWSVFIALGYFVIFGFLDGLFWGASLKKVSLDEMITVVENLS